MSSCSFTDNTTKQRLMPSLVINISSCSCRRLKSLGIDSEDEAYLRVSIDPSSTFSPSRDDKSVVHYSYGRCHRQHISATHLLYRQRPHYISVSTRCYFPRMVSLIGAHWMMAYGLSKLKSRSVRIRGVSKYSDFGPIEGYIS